MLRCYKNWVPSTPRGQPPTCFYADPTRGLGGRLPPACSGAVTHVVRRYFRGEDKAQHGRDLFLCQVHVRWRTEISPLGPAAEPL